MPATFSSVPIAALTGPELLTLSKARKLSLSEADMLVVQQIFRRWEREPTDVELEVIAQTWSEHCKHRIFGSEIRHQTPAGEQLVDGLFRTYVKEVTEEIREARPDFVLSAFHDNAGFVRLDENSAVCLKVETHNHPSAIEPYAGANTGLGGVIRDILGAGKGAKPIGSLDVFCFGAPDTKPEEIRGEGVIHPLGILKGVVRGVRDYGNRMGIPTVAGALQFDPAYLYNPLVYCGTAGVIPIPDIEKAVESGDLVVAVGGRTGRDGLKGATFSSAGLDTESHEEDQQAVQIGNPIEEKKVCDFLLEARKRGWIGFVTDCGAGGFSSAAGEMLSEIGGELHLERALLKEEGLASWEIFISESQERMVLAVKQEHLDDLEMLAGRYETEICVLGKADGSGVLKVLHEGEMIGELRNEDLHEAPRQYRTSRWDPPEWREEIDWSSVSMEADFPSLLSDLAICSRSPIIREYDHEVQGNTVLKPLAGAKGDAPQDGSVLEIQGSERLLALGLSLLPEWGKTDPQAMGKGVVDECVRQLVCMGANPEKIAILDNFCMGNPDDETELGALVESCQGMAEAARAYGAPFVSGKDSFYNFFEVDGEPISIPVTLLLSGMGIVDSLAQVTGASLRRTDSVILLLGTPTEHLGGSVFARQKGWENLRVPSPNFSINERIYGKLHQWIRQGTILSAHDVSEGGLGVALAEMTFSEIGGVRVETELSLADWFSEQPGQILIEVSSDDADDLVGQLEDEGLPGRRMGCVIEELSLVTPWGSFSVAELKRCWQGPLQSFYEPSA
ncbi:MAG: phosphoribosylformylglycinamidine synthase subunit PurL [Verrucomicrobiota bacterium]